LTFVEPCIVIYFCSKTNQMHNISNLFYFGTTLYMFRTVCGCLLTSSHGTCMAYTWCCMYRLRFLKMDGETVRNMSETCRVLFQNKINLRCCASGWFYYRNVRIFILMVGWPCILVWPWFDLQLDALNYCLFTYNTFIKILYMFRALTLLIIRRSTS